MLALIIYYVIFHCRGRDFRQNFMELSTLKALFPNSVALALTATAPPTVINIIKINLCLSKQAKIIKASPNRKNLFLCVKKRLPNSMVL